MDKSIESLIGTAPSLLLMGMRGAGKTTLGRLASEHLRVPFIDADELFSTRFAPHTAKTFVAEHGWPAFRAEETKLLIEILAQIQQQGKAMVVGLGGGIVEEEINRKLLKDCWCNELSGQFDRSKRIAVVHIFREVDNVLLDVRGLPSWGVTNGHEVWERRRPFFREACKCCQIRFKQTLLSILLFLLFEQLRTNLSTLPMLTTLKLFTPNHPELQDYNSKPLNVTLYPFSFDS